MRINWGEIEKLFPRAKVGVIDALANNAITLMSLTNEVRFCYCLANLAHETGGFQWLKELGGDKYFTKLYEGRKSLGNTEPGDGAKYAGRGLIHVTGRANYQACQEYTDIPCIEHPELLERPIEAVQSTAWYWNTRGYKDLSLNDWCDRRDFLRVVKIINGGTNGFQNRRKYLSMICKVVGVNL